MSRIALIYPNGDLQIKGELIEEPVANVRFTSNGDLVCDIFSEVPDLSFDGVIAIRNGKELYIKGKLIEGFEYFDDAELLDEQWEIDDSVELDDSMRAVDFLHFILGITSIRE